MVEPVVYRLADNMLGLDPLLRVFVKLYIGDIHTLQADRHHQGIYYYKSHPVQRVDIVGVVVKVQQKPKFTKYFVDDGTGVIPVICWQNDQSTNQQHWLEEIDPCLAVLVETADHRGSESHYQLGDLIHAQGKIKEFHEQREISAYTLRKCTDPMEEVVRMAELPDLYTKVYDRPFQPPARVAEELLCSKSPGKDAQSSLLLDLEGLILSSFPVLDGDRFVLDDLLKLEGMKDLFVKANTDSDSNREYIEKALKQLEVKGFIFPTHQGIYRVVSLCRDLEDRILQILTQECQNTKYAESGCHVLRVYDILRRQLDFSKVTKVTVESCLETLESRSDIISTSNCHYIAFGT